MSVESTRYGQILTEVMVETIDARDQLFRDKAIAANAEQDRLDQEATPEMRLAKAAMELADRMVWLFDHPRKARFLGHSAAARLIEPVRQVPDEEDVIEGAITTRRMFGTETLDISEGSLVDDYVFSTYKYRASNWRALRIDERTTETEMGTQRTHNSWLIRAFQPDGKQVVRADFIPADTEYEAAAKQAILQTYVEAHPWLMHEDWTSIGIPYDLREALRRSDDAARRHKGTLPPLDEQEVPKRDEEVLNKVKWQMLRGNGWDFPEEFYTLPYGLILQAQEELS